MITCRNIQDKHFLAGLFRGCREWKPYIYFSTVRLANMYFLNIEISRLSRETSETLADTPTCSYPSQARHWCKHVCQNTLFLNKRPIFRMEQRFWKDISRMMLALLIPDVENKRNKKMLGTDSNIYFKALRLHASLWNVPKNQEQSGPQVNMYESVLKGNYSHIRLPGSSW